jgi:SAM-dependent methyltransferase
MGEPDLYDWAAHYTAADTPWDLGGAHPELSQRLSDGTLAPPRAGARVLVPGCGHGHDALALARRGWDVTAIDLVVDLAQTLGRELARRGGRFLQVDALAVEAGPDGPFDLVWDHTFFCALPPTLRAAWGARAAALTAPDGRYVALVFPCGKPLSEGGPPFGMTTEDVALVLGTAFELEDDRPVARPVARRTWPERIASFRRT